MDRPRPPQTRPLRPALGRGWRGACPNCGAGRMFAGYPSVRDTCPRCGVALHHRAEHGPAYLPILLVGHLLAPAMFFVFFRFEPEHLPMALGFSAATIGLSLYLLPRIKGALVALQWANRMHGFGQFGARG